MVEFLPVCHGPPIHPALTQEGHYQAIEFLHKVLNEPFRGSTVIVTHHAPSFLSEHSRWARR
ncbi:MAG: hypothetical protein OWR62_15425 [Sulfobacillus thermotolerans]|nr:hypothetical protein [Sulfobacillus thermotolerans]